MREGGEAAAINIVPTRMPALLLLWALVTALALLWALVTALAFLWAQLPLLPSSALVCLFESRGRTKKGRKASGPSLSLLPPSFLPSFNSLLHFLPSFTSFTFIILVHWQPIWCRVTKLMPRYPCLTSTFANYLPLPLLSCLSSPKIITIKHHRCRGKPPPSSLPLRRALSFGLLIRSTNHQKANYGKLKVKYLKADLQCRGLSVRFYSCFCFCRCFCFCTSLSPPLLLRAHIYLMQTHIRMGIHTFVKPHTCTHHTHAFMYVHRPLAIGSPQTRPLD